MAEPHNNGMYDLLAKYFAGEADDTEVIQLQAWRNASGANAAEYDCAERAWAASETVIWQESALFDAGAAWSELQFRISDEPDDLPAKFRFLTLKTLSRIAAILIVAAISSFVIWYMVTKKDDTVRISCTGDNIETRLADSSVITLKDNSELAWSQGTFGLKDRRVKFHGTGYFKIAPDKEKPFIVDLNGVNVKVVGTEFNIESRTSCDTAIISVMKGAVLIYDSLGHRVTVLAGQQAIYSRRNASLIGYPTTDRNAAAWKTKTLIFERTEISEVIRVLKMVYGTNIILKKEKLNNCRITATFSNEKIDGVIRIIAETFNLTVEQQGENYILDGDGC